MSEKRVQKILEKIDDYAQTLEAMISFSHVLRYDDKIKNFRPNSYSFIARKMNTTKNNRINPEIEVTPDLIVQLNRNYGIITEAKKSLPQNQKFWKRKFDQLEKYDDNLQGWKTENEYIDTSDLVLIVHYKISVEVSDYIDKRIKNNSLVFDRNFSLIAFQRSQNRKLTITLAKSYGDLSNTNLDNRFRKIVRVPYDELIIHFNRIKFYDDKPELPYIMDILWNNVFNQYPQIEEFMEAKGKKIINIRVNINDLTEKLRIQFSDYLEGDRRQKAIPATKWIREAMEMFVKLNYAKKNGNDDYIVKYKNLQMPLEKFVRAAYKKRTKTLNAYIYKSSNKD